QRDAAGSAQTARRLAQLLDQRGPFPGRTRAQLRLHDAERARRGGAGIPRRRDRAGGESDAAPPAPGSRSREEEAPEGEAAEAAEAQEEAEGRSRQARQRRPSAGA